MKKYISLAAILIFTAYLMSSCIKDDSSSASSVYEDTAITSFTLGTVKVSRVVGKKKYAKDSEGNPLDSIYTYSYSGSKTPVIIDHLSREIYNNDSLPAGSHMKMLASISAKNSATIVYRDWDAADDASWTYYNSGDSILFGEDGGESKYIRFRVLATQNGYTRDYKVQIVAHKEYADSFQYKELGKQAIFAEAQSLRAASIDESLYVLVGKESSSTLYYSEDKGETWTESDTFGADATIAAAYDMLFVLDNGKLYCTDGETSKTIDVSAYNLKAVVGGCNQEFYAINADGRIMVTSLEEGNLGAEWVEDDVYDNSDLVPTRDICSATVVQKVNMFISRITMVGNKASYTEKYDTCAVVWNKNVDLVERYDQPWIYNNPTDAKVKSVALPAMKNLSTTGYYNGWLLAIGGEGLNEVTPLTTKPLERIFCSEDGGTSWHKLAGLRMPGIGTDDPLDGNMPAVIIRASYNYFYIISADEGRVFRCKLNNATWEPTEDREIQ